MGADRPKEDMMVNRYWEVLETRKSDGERRSVRYVVQSTMTGDRLLARSDEERYAKARDAWGGFRLSYRYDVRTDDGRALADIESVAYPREDIEAVLDEMRALVSRHLQRKTNEAGEPIDVRLLVGHLGE